MRLILIRHGQTSSNVGGNLDTAIPGAPLTGLGQQQAGAVPAAVAGEPIGAIYVSTLQRTQQTAAPLAQALGLTPVIRDGLREIEAGELEMLADYASVERYLTTMVAWGRGELDTRMPGAESGHEAFARFNDVIIEIASLGLDTVAVVSHGAIIRCWSAMVASNVDADFVAEHALTNTGVVVLVGSPTDGWYVETWTGQAVGGPRVTDLAGDGPAG